MATVKRVLCTLVLAVATIGIVFAGSLPTGQHDDDVVTLTHWTSE